MVKQMLLKNIHIPSLTLNFNCLYFYFWCWISTWDCKISVSRAIRIPDSFSFSTMGDMDWEYFLRKMNLVSWNPIYALQHSVKLLSFNWYTITKKHFSTSTLEGSIFSLLFISSSLYILKVFLENGSLVFSYFFHLIRAS